VILWGDPRTIWRVLGVGWEAMGEGRALSETNQSELCLVGHGGHAHLLAEAEAEGGLVGETGFAGDLTDAVVAVLEEFACGLEANFEDEGLGAEAEGFDEASVELPFGQVDVGGQLSDGDFFPEVFADPDDSLVDGEVWLEHGFGFGVALGGAHDADDEAFAIKDGQFVSDEPVGDALGVEEEFGDVEFGPSGGHDLLVVSAKVFGEARRGQLVIIFSDQFSFGAESEAPIEVGIGGHQSGVAVFGEESDARHQVKERVIRTFRSDGSEKAIAFPHRIVGPVAGWCRFFHDV
jgi:hypothetical protein